MKYEKMDITTVCRGVIAHGVNAQRAMGSGVALAIKNKWPVVYTKYMEQPKGSQMLGVAHGINVNGDDSVWVVNCYTQEYFGADGKVYADPNAIETSLRGAYQLAKSYDMPIYLPQIGAGLGGLDWDQDVKPIINDLDQEFETVDTTICIWG